MFSTYLVFNRCWVGGWKGGCREKKKARNYGYIAHIRNIFLFDNF